MPDKEQIDQEIDDFVGDWHCDKQSHTYARELGKFLFQFIADLERQGLSDKTVRKHTDNCWHIGILECNYSYRKKFSAGDVFYSPEADYEYEFKRKMSDSTYTINSYKSTWKKVYQYAKSLGLTD